LTHVTTSFRKMVLPSQYIQGRGAIYYLGQKAVPLGDKAFVVGGKTALSVTADRLRKSLASNGIEAVAWNDTVKECTHATIGQLAEQGKRSKAHFVVGVGGGRAIDTAKAVAAKLKVPEISVGTQCASNADCSAMSVVYTEDHKYLETLVLSSNPYLVVEDTEIIFKAPAKFMIWGMGDALSVKFEAESYGKARERKKDGQVPTAAALALADACHKVLLQQGVQAIKDVRSEIHSQAVDDIIEAVKLSSAMAFENTGSGLAHALHNGLMKTGQIRGEHGEIIAYTTLVQAAYDKRPKDEIRAIASWCEHIGLPTRLKYLGDPAKSALRIACEHAAEKDHNVRNMPEKIKPADLMKAMDEVEKGF